MMKRQWKISWIVLTAIIVHGTWGVILLFDDAPLQCTPLATSPFHDNQYLAAVVYLIATALAICHFSVERLDRSFLGLCFLAPQQFLMMMSAFGAIGCVLGGAYADGVPRPRLFILADQLWGIVGMVFHTFSILDWFYFSRVKGG